MTRTILVTGGTGLVGKGVEIVSKEENPDNDKFIFLSSKDGDLRYDYDSLQLVLKWRLKILLFYMIVFMSKSLEQVRTLHTVWFCSETK